MSKKEKDFEKIRQISVQGLNESVTVISSDPKETVDVLSKKVVELLQKMRE